MRRFHEKGRRKLKETFLMHFTARVSSFQTTLMSFSGRKYFFNVVEWKHNIERAFCEKLFAENYPSVNLSIILFMAFLWFNFMLMMLQIKIWIKGNRARGKEGGDKLVLSGILCNITFSSEDPPLGVFEAFRLPFAGMSLCALLAGLMSVKFYWISLAGAFYQPNLGPFCEREWQDVHAPEHNSCLSSKKYFPVSQLFFDKSLYSKDGFGSFIILVSWRHFFCRQWCHPIKKIFQSKLRCI